MARTQAVSALSSGLLFGSGLALSGMTDPDNITAFLDVAGAWRPALAVVMASAIAVAAPAYAWVRYRKRTLSGQTVDINNHRPIDIPLLVGAAIFGIGWGLSGLCPGPALMLAVSQPDVAGIFVATLAIGLGLTGYYLPKSPR